MSIKLIATLANTMLDLITTQIDTGAGTAKISVYDDTAAQPANPDTAVPGTSVLLAEFLCTDPAAAAASASTLTLSAIADDVSANNSGTALWARITSPDTNAVLDVDVSATGGGGTLQFNTATFVAGKTVSIDSFVITL